MFAKTAFVFASLAFAGAATAAEFFAQARAGIASIDHFRLDDDEPAGQILVGARWGHFGVEAGYLQTQRFTDHFVSERLANFAIDYADRIDGFFVGLNARCMFGGGPWHATGRVGAMHWSMEYDAVPSRSFPASDYDASDTDLYVGAGIGRDFGDHFSVGVALDYFRLDGEDDELVYIDASMRAWSLTLEYRF